jgi:hypothetical protein
MSDEVWQAIEKIREQHAATDKIVAVIQHEQEMQRKMITEQHGQLAADIGVIRAKIDTMATDIHEARGGLRVGRWLGGITTALVAVGVSILAYIKGGS